MSITCLKCDKTRAFEYSTALEIPRIVKCPNKNIYFVMARTDLKLTNDDAMVDLQYMVVGAFADASSGKNRDF